MMPFVTEEIWRQLPLAPADRAPSLMVAAWPSPDGLAHWRDERGKHGEQAIMAVQAVVTAVRTIRARYSVAPRASVDVIVKGTGRLAHLVEAEADIIRSLAGVGALTVSADAAKPAHSAVAVALGAEIFVPLEGLVDFAHERARVEKDLAAVVMEMERLAAKLGNAGFLAKASPEIVEKDRARAAALAEQSAKLEGQLTELSD
jgi:valyl-tRNA synthetase